MQSRFLKVNPSEDTLIHIKYDHPARPAVVHTFGISFSAISVSVCWSIIGTPSSSAFCRMMGSSNSLKVVGRRFAFCTASNTQAQCSHQSAGAAQ